MNEEYDIVIDVLQKHYDRLWNLSKSADEWGIMDHIRLEQMDQLKEAIKLWKESHDVDAHVKRILGQEAYHGLPQAERILILVGLLLTKKPPHTQLAVKN